MNCSGSLRTVWVLTQEKVDGRGLKPRILGDWRYRGFQATMGTGLGVRLDEALDIPASRERYSVYSNTLSFFIDTQ